MTMTLERFTTPKQAALIRKLYAEGRVAESPDHTVAVPADVHLLTSREASTLIDRLLASPVTAPRVVGGVEPPVSDPGMYRTADGTMYKVQRAKQTGNLYAKQLVPIGGKRLTEPGEVVHWEFQFAPGAVYNLKAAQRLTLEEAKAFGIRYGVCCVCGAFLKDAVSVANGIGPVCAKRL